MKQSLKGLTVFKMGKKGEGGGGGYKSGIQTKQLAVIKKSDAYTAFITINSTSYKWLYKSIEQKCLFKWLIINNTDKPALMETSLQK